RPGTYKVEANRIGYETETQTVEIGKHTSKKLDFKLKKIHEARRKTIQGSRSDEDKIINPGEVIIQPPTMKGASAQPRSPVRDRRGGGPASGRLQRSAGAARTQRPAGPKPTD